MEIKNYDPNCAMCNFLEGNTIDIVYEGIYNKVAINPRISPHLFRTAVIPMRHMGADGKYGLELLNKREREEYRSLRLKTTDAIIGSADGTGNRLDMRDGQPDVEYIERPCKHPTGDLFPRYKEPARLGGYVFPRCVDAEIEANSFSVNSAPVILASFADKSLIMPEDLRREIVSILKENF